MPSKRTTLLSPCAQCGQQTSKRFCSRACYSAYRQVRAMNYSARFWAFVDASGDCWLWRGQRNGRGYGRFAIRPVASKLVLRAAHRAAWELLVGPIPKGMTIDHLCRVVLCVNPDHLEVVPPGVNTLRGFNPSALNARKISCKNGHSDWFIRPNGNRECRQCPQSGCQVRTGRVKHGLETECIRGHNDWKPRRTGGRACRECKRLYERRTTRPRRRSEASA
jgi:hypothetical protein